ncbi:hypothetical protein BM1_06081 [Bipolaris maydis]|nr:hypothetical protein BM1_06081 [Bipolaris maydis]
MPLEHMLPKPSFPTVTVAQSEQEIKSPTVSPITPVERVDSPGLRSVNYSSLTEPAHKEDPCEM